jgi:hypothetical protein
MIPKKILTKEFKLQLAPFERWIKRPFTADLLQNCKELKPTDILLNITHIQPEPTIGWGNDDDNEDRYYAPYLIVTREVLETDEEYMERISVDERRKEELENREYLEFLRLSAKYKNRNLQL